MRFRKFKRNMLQIENVVGGLTLFIWIGVTILMLSQDWGDAGLLALLSVPIAGFVAIIFTGILIGILRLTTLIVKYFKP